MKTKDINRIENIQKATLNGRKVKLFKAFEYDDNAKAYIFIGQFKAPQTTANKDLQDYIAED